jgi:hypothetical protein
VHDSFPLYSLYSFYSLYPVFCSYTLGRRYFLNGRRPKNLTDAADIEASPTTRMAPQGRTHDDRDG